MSVAAFYHKEKRNTKLNSDGKAFHSFASFISFHSFNSIEFSLHSKQHISCMLSKLIKEKIEARFGKRIRYAKEISALAEHMSQSCGTRISASTLMRLYGFVKGISEPRLHTLDIIAEYLGYKGWEEFLASFDRKEDPPQKPLEKLKPEQIKNGQTVQLTYEPSKTIELKKTGSLFMVVSSNEKKLALNDEIKFGVIELHYPFTLTQHFREGKSLGRTQLATISGLTSIRKI